MERKANASNGLLIPDVLIGHRLTPIAEWLLAGPGLPILFALVYAIAFLIPFPLLTCYNDHNAAFSDITRQNKFAAIGMAAADLALVVLYWQMWRVARSRPGTGIIYLILVGWLTVSVILLFTYPGQSSDLGDYTFRAHMLVHLGKNPMVVAPSDIVAKADFPYIGWFWEVDAYGPLWSGLAVVAHVLAGESFLANILAFKILGTIFIGISGGLIYSLLRRIAPHRAEEGLVLWLWNPVVLNEGVLHGHNDLVMVALTLAGLWLLLRGRDTWGLVMLIASGLVKANAWILLPAAIVWVWRTRGWRGTLRPMALASLIGTALICLTYMPFGGWMRLFEMVRHRGWWPTGTWTAVLFFILRDGLGWPHSVVVQWVIGSASLLFMVIAGTAIVKIRSLRVCVWAVVLAYLLVGCHWFQPWYATWLIALTAVAISRQRVSYTCIFSYFMLLHPIMAQYLATQIALPIGGYHALMAIATLLVPQVLALRLCRSVKQKAAR